VKESTRKSSSTLKDKRIWKNETKNKELLEVTDTRRYLKRRVEWQESLNQVE
jgi:hypothetical protein